MNVIKHNFTFVFTDPMKFILSFPALDKYNSTIDKTVSSVVP